MVKDTRPFRIWFWYNHVKRHFRNVRFWFIWKFSKDPKKPDFCPMAGALSATDWAWAGEKIEELKRDGKII